VISATHGIRDSSLPTSVLGHDAFFANLGQLLAPASPATNALGHANATNADWRPTSVADPTLAASATVGSDPIQVSHQDTRDVLDDDLGLWVPATR
jgi:hypothetical protein